VRAPVGGPMVRPSQPCRQAGGLHNGAVRLTIVGFGLIGGSVARALRELDPSTAHLWRITAWSRTRGPVDRAFHDGVIDAAPDSLEGALRDAELVLLAAPPLICLDLLDQLAGPLRSALGDATLTDAVSTKAQIVTRADMSSLHFVGGHPMAGRESSGYAAAAANLFVGRPWVTVPGANAALVDSQRVRSLIQACGAVEVPMTAEAHDSAVAAISHVPLVVSAALVEAVAGRDVRSTRSDWPAARNLAATGWAGMTRLARGEPSMGAGIAATNPAAISARLRDVRAVLDEWLAELESPEGPDFERLQERFAAARDRLEQG
jgi:prephenate dehydrogenase